MFFNHNQNNDSLSSFSKTSKYTKPDLVSKYDNLKKYLQNLRTKVDKITSKSEDLKEDSKEDYQFESLDFIKEI